jgi:formylglycine-generating enzyme required for sulfatase activity
MTISVPRTLNNEKPGYNGKDKPCSNFYRGNRMARMFISYRRDDTGGYSLLLFDRLARVFGRNQIFMDIDSLEPGRDFVEVIQKAVGSCDALLALIGKQWLTIADENGCRRIDMPEDFVRLEIAAALERNIRVIPVLVRGARMPSSDELPEVLRPLARRHAVALSDGRIDYDLQRLVGVLGRLPTRSGEAAQSWLDTLARPATDEIVLSAPETVKRRSKLSIPRATRLLFEPETVPIPAGSFLQGENNLRVTLPEFWIGKYPVKVSEYRAFIQEGGYNERRFWTQAGWAWKEATARTKPDDWDSPVWTGDDWLPMIGVSWYEAYAYCNWLAAKSHWPYRLPTSLEWEKAARGTEGHVYPWGNERQKVQCNVYGIGMGQTSRVGLYSPQSDSPYGAADMIGNVSEWCLTRWNKDSLAPPNDDPDGDGPRVRHGGSWASANLVRPSTRIRGDPTFTSNYVGFRVARSPLE